MTLAMIMIVKMKIIITLVLTVMLTTSRFMGVCNIMTLTMMMII